MFTTRRRDQDLIAYAALATQCPHPYIRHRPLSYQCVLTLVFFLAPEVDATNADGSRGYWPTTPLSSLANLEPTAGSYFSSFLLRPGERDRTL